MFKQYIAGVILLVIGFLAGATAHYVYSHSQVEYKSNTFELFSTVVRHSQFEIKPENFRCENFETHMVGDVLSSIISNSNAHQVNAMETGCFNDVCSISYTDCKPWQSTECGSRMLVFSQPQNGQIDPSSFTCLDIP